MFNPAIHLILFNSCYLYAKWKINFWSSTAWYLPYGHILHLREKKKKNQGLLLN